MADQKRNTRYGNFTRNLREQFQSGDDMDRFLETLLRVVGLDKFETNPDFETSEILAVCDQIDALITTHQIRELTECLFREMQMIRMMMAARMGQDDEDVLALLSKIDQNCHKIISGTSLPTYIKDARAGTIDEVVMLLTQGGKAKDHEKDYDDELEKS